jgi:SAM-dependent methyltransferase
MECKFDNVDFLATNPDFDEADYLAANPDVATAVGAGGFSSGAEHYARYGIHENRSLNPRQRPRPLKLPFPAGAIPSRRDKILANLTISALDGVEIGALATPLVRPAEGNIVFVDYADTKTLQDTNRTDPAVDVANIVDVDAVWGSQTLQECIGVDKKVDYVIASHVIEHVPDLVTWLAEIRAILRPKGSLRLAVPDRRYTFDYLRFESRVHDVLDAYLQRARAPLPRQIIEHYSLMRDVDCTSTWNGTVDVRNLRPVLSTAAGLECAQDAIANGTYIDLHCWVFTPVSFAELCIEMAKLDLLGLACEHHFDTARNENEFFVHMTVSDSKTGIIASWERMRASVRQP